MKTRHTVREKRERLRVDERLTGRGTAKLTKLCITVTYISIVKTRFIHTDETRNAAFQRQHKISIPMSYLCLCLVNRMRFQITTQSTAETSSGKVTSSNIRGRHHKIKTACIKKLRGDEIPGMPVTIRSRIFRLLIC